MSHFSKKTSPLKVIFIAYIYVVIIGLILFGSGFYKNNRFFNWGPPVTFFGEEVKTQAKFYALHVLIFFHQIVNNCVNSVVYAWIINSVQDPKNRNLEYSRLTSLLIINAFNVYSELDLVLIIVGFMSQISFVLTIIIANTITSTYINNSYILQKRYEPLLDNKVEITGTNYV